MLYLIITLSIYHFHFNYTFVLFYKNRLQTKESSIVRKKPFHFQDQTESAAILKIKESMQEEAKRFEKDNEQPEYYMT